MIPIIPHIHGQVKHENELCFIGVAADSVESGDCSLAAITSSQKNCYIAVTDLNFRSSLTFYGAKCPSLGGELSVVGPRPYANRQPASLRLIRGDAPKAKSRSWRRRISIRHQLQGIPMPPWF
jgi:hypothetical protein